MTYDISALGDLEGKMLSLQQADTLLRLVADRSKNSMKDRIHTNGQKADGSAIGTYSDKYLKFRQKNGFATTGSDIKLVLTGQMENDWKVIAISDTEYGIGYDNKFNADKADWAEERFGEIFKLTESEYEEVKTIIDEYIKSTFE